MILFAAMFMMTAVAHAHERAVQFPQGFHWCVSTSAHQIEGYNTNSDWWDWEQIPGHVANGEKSGAACDHWNRVAEDTDLLQNLGVDYYRFSIEWAKIEPSEGNFDHAAMQHYRDEVQLLLKKGITPMITLHHFTMPRWLREKGGWEWDGAPDAFARFAEVVYTEIAPEVRDWITFNEPMVHVLGGYYEGLTPPGEHRSLAGTIPVLRGLLKAHARAYHVLHNLARDRGTEVRVGMAHHMRTFDAAVELNPLDHVAMLYADQAWNWLVPNALETGVLSFHFLWFANDDERIPELAGTQDFIGVNYYTGDLIAFSFTQGIVQKQRKNLPKTDVGWDIYPEGFRRIVTAVAKRYPSLPIWITENGIADATDQKRPKFILDHLEKLHEAIREGARVEGYCYWSSMDNFEWISGFAPRFGLYAVDYRTFERTPRPSADLFRDIALHNGFTRK